MFSLDLRHWPFIRKNDSAPSSSALGWMFLTTNIFFSATYSTFTKLLTESLSPTSILVLSELLTIMFTFFFFGVLPVMRSVFALKRKQLAPLLTIGVTNGILGPLLWFTGIHYTTVVNAALFSNAEMMFLALMAVLILREEWTLTHFLSISAILFGITVISLKGFTDGLTIQFGDLLIVMAGLSFATGSIVFRKFLMKTEPQVVVFMRSLVPVVVFMLVAPFVQMPVFHETVSISIMALALLLGFGLFARFLNTFTFYEALDRLPVATVSLFSNLATIVAILIAHYGLGEPVLGYHFVGGAFIALGTVLLEVIGIHPSEKHHEVHLIERKTSRA